MKKIPIVLALLLFAVSAKAESVPKQDSKQIFCVNANAEIYVKPDRVHLTLGVSDRSKDLHAAKERMGEILKKAIAFCKANGIPDKHIQSSYISIQPDYWYDDKNTKNMLRYYELTQTFTITLEKPEKYEVLLYSLLDMGINNVQNVSFATSELRKYRDEARLAAVRAAQEKAKLLTDAVGIKLGKAINIHDNLHVGSSLLNRSQNMMSQNVTESMYDALDGGEGFALGTIPVRAEVTVTYELE